MTSKYAKEMIALENGEIPDHFDFSVESYLEKKTIIPFMTYKTFTQEFVYNYYDPALLEIFPCLVKIAKEEYEANKHRTPLDEINERIKEAQKIKSADILYDC